MKYSAFASLIIFLMSIFISCKRNLDAPAYFEKQQMLEDIADQCITPAFSNFKEECSTLSQNFSIFQQNPDIENLQSLQAQWEITALAWEACVGFNFGDISNTYVYNKIESRPPNTSFLEYYIADTTVLDNDFVETTGSSSKGLPAIEYLIYHSNGDNAIVLDSLTNHPRRMMYLSALVENLQNKSIALNNTWADYYPTFISYEGNNIGGSVSDIVNRMSNVLETAYMKSLGAPLGKNNFVNIGHPENVEAPISQMSLDFIKADIAAIEKIFFNDGQNLLGFDDYLNAHNSKYNGLLLSLVLKNQFQKVNTALDAIPGTLGNAVIDSYALVESAYNELKELVVLMKVDVASELSITITFNDNDGD